MHRRVMLSFVGLFVHFVVVAQLPKVNICTWLKADSGVTYDINGKLSLWLDNGLRNNHFRQTDNTKQPLWIDSVYSNLPGIRFDGVNSLMQSDSFINLTSKVNGYSVFVLAKNSVRKNYNGLFRIAISDADSSVLELGWQAGLSNLNSGNFIIGVNRDFGLSFIQLDNTGPPVNEFYLCEASVSSDSIKIVINNNVLFKGSSLNLLPLFGKMKGILGKSYKSGSSLDGYICEFLLYDSVQTKSRISIYQYLSEKYHGKPFIGNDTLLTSFCPLVLDVNKSFNKYLWSSGEITKSISINEPGKYWVRTLNEFGFYQYDTINVAYPSAFTLPLINTICNGASLVWDTKLSKSNYTFQWQDSSIDSLFTITQAGKYYVQVSDTSGCSIVSDTVNVTLNTFGLTTFLGVDTTFCSGNTIALLSGDPQTKSYLWSTGSTNSSIAIVNTGQYSLIATDSLGCVAKDTINVTINGIAPKANFSFAPILCNGDSIKFSDLSLPPGGNTISGYLWNFGDSKTSTLSSPTHLYQLPDTGKYNVKLTVTTNVGCDKDTTLQLHVYPKPLVNFSNTLACNGHTAKFTDLTNLKGYSPINYYWNFSDPASGTDSASVMSNPLHVFTDAGTSNIKLIITSNSGCIDSLTKAINVYPTPIVAYTTSVTCEKKSIQFTDNSSVASPWVLQSYSTNFGDASPTTTVKNPSHTYTIIGPYQTKYIVSSNNGCSDTLLSIIDIAAKPITKFNINGPFCLNNSIGLIDTSVVNGSSINAWQWTIDGSTNAATKSIMNSFSTTGNHTAKLSVTSAEGCKDSLTKSFIINALPVPDFSFSPLFGDPPLAISFSNLSSTGVINSSWDFGDASGQSHIVRINYLSQKNEQRWIIKN